MNRPHRLVKLFAGLAATFAVAGTGLAQPAAAPAADAGAAPASLTVYFGTYTGPKKGKGIYRAKLDLATGALTQPEVAAETASPSFIAVHPNKRFLYAVGETADFGGKKSGAVGAFAIDASTGALAALNQQPSGGGGPCYVSLDKEGKNVLVANYGGGSVEVLPVGADGRLGDPSSFVQHATPKEPAGSRQKAPHAHSIQVDPTNRFVLAADLGLNEVLVYKFDASAGKLTPNDPPAGKVPAGSGPRHFAFHPNGKFAFVINELASTVTAFAYDADKGTLTEVQTLSTLPGGDPVKGNSTAEVVVHPSGKFVYGSNRGHDSIAVFAVDEATGKLTAAGHTPTGGKTPRNFNVDPTGQYLLAANQGSDTVVVFKIDPAKGTLTPTGTTVSIPSPVCVKFVALGR